MAPSTEHDFAPFAIEMTNGAPARIKQFERRQGTVQQKKLMLPEIKVIMRQGRLIT
jgi:hypothetical protein